MKKFIRISLILVVMLVLLRGYIFRQVVVYQTVGHRVSYPITNPDLKAYLNAHACLSEHCSETEIINRALTLTADHLHFTAANNSVDPNRLYETQAAHCVGYAAFFTTACNYFFKEKGMDDTWTAHQHIGQLLCFGLNVHPFFSTPFFRDHDFVIIQNRQTGEKIAVDPNMYDYLYIQEISFR